MTGAVLGALILDDDRQRPDPGRRVGRLADLVRGIVILAAPTGAMLAFDAVGARD